MCRLPVEVDFAGEAERRGSDPAAPEGELERRRLDGVGFMMLSIVSL